MKALLLSLIVLFATGFYSNAFASVIPTVPHIYVEGFAEKEITPDQIKLTVSIAATHKMADKAKTEVDDKTLQLFNATKTIGLTRQHITATPLQISPVIDYENGVKVDKGTRVSRNIDIVLNDLSKYSQLNNLLVAAKITSKVASVVEMKDQRAVTKSVLMLALEDAKLKAQALASLQGKKIKDVHSISEFKTRKEDAYSLVPSQQIYGQSFKNSAMRYRAAESENILEVGKMRATATVYVVYTLE